MNTEQFLEKVKAIADSEPAYKLGHSGSDGFCDCVGLIIGACQRNGIKWPDIHGSNYAARHQTIGLTDFSSVAELELGDLVYKAKKPGDSGYNLPKRYEKDPDQLDYYHIGVVTHVKPLTITHVTTPTTKLDSKIGNWKYKGKLKLISEGDQPMNYEEATVVADEGSSVKLRSSKSTASSYTNIPVGTVVQVEEKEEAWCKVNVNGRTGYMMTKFLKFGSEPSTDAISVSRAELTKIYEALGKLLKA